ncbi:methylated-DNA--[protein]-cysteine S-methyltransferase [Hymenobacter lutimineralis]|uniref:methylated-DNA--[protein]-cysteine S-methyltransferase n=1 Tax=Hymenobacter lutimineralis TaxID=2606448 RepID=A0A5D6VC43_9BACT|nr:methylated-DNA--[protein]-cysteine S-methyltransferase [Hymenobacter lutimineralis]TYZ12488.1 methylated-DNA--[protein]-cysteine S-methyltransferase [Hymenobacter lutimineralis]
MSNDLSARHQEYYQALVDKNGAYEGSFIAAVKTTGIFCRPTCTARKPKPENVEFFAGAREALLHGYRACKVCTPLEKPGETPTHIQDLLRDLHAAPASRLTDAQLRARGLEPATLRRWFLKNHGLTFQAYQRMVRLNGAFKRIQRGESVTGTAYEAGYESLSGFQDSFKAVFGVAPSNSRQQGVIDLTRLETPLGPMLACAVPQGICLLEFADRKMLETELKYLTRRLNAAIVPGPNPHFELLQQQLNEYFRGHRREFSVPLFAPGTPFQQAVWRALQTIPYGSVRSYQQQAASLLQPGAQRAVATANGLNRISILVPCHRVVASNGQLAGYGGGLWRKQWLLNLEAQHTPRHHSLASDMVPVSAELKSSVS